MAYKQPRVPPMKEGRIVEYIRELVLFLKDFSLETWTAVTQLQREKGVVSVNGKTGEVTLDAGDVGARADTWTPTAEQTGALPADAAAKDSEKLGGKAPQYYMQPRNLLDNSDFTNPVNQRGVTHVTRYGYTLDRWLMYPIDEGAGYSVTVDDGSISLVNAKFEQRIERYLPGAVYTAAAKKTDGSVVVFSGDFRSDANTEGPIYLKISSSGHAVFGITNGEYVWTALYEGEYTSDTLPPYVPKGTAAETLECQRYYLPLSADPFFGGQTYEAGGGAWIQIPTPTKMRTVPTLHLGGGTMVIRCNGSDANISSYGVQYVCENQIVLQVNGSFPRAQACASYIKNNAAPFLSAEL